MPAPKRWGRRDQTYPRSSPPGSRVKVPKNRSGGPFRAGGHEADRGLPPLEAGAPDVVSSIGSRKSPVGSLLRPDERPGPDTTPRPKLET